MIYIKVETNTPSAPKSFQPQQLVITFETQAELDRWTSVFNHSRLTDFLSPDMSVYRALSKLGGDYNPFWTKVTGIFRL